MREEQSFPTGGYPKPVAQEFGGKTVTLRPMNVAADAAELFTASHCGVAAGDTWRYMPSGPFPDAVSMSLWLYGRMALPDMLPFTVRSRESGRIVGSISLMSIRPEHGVAELGFIWYVPEARRTKVNTEANFLLLRYCFEQLRYRRMEWKCDAENLPSRAAAERLGYRFEGVFRKHQVVKGRNRDTAWFAMLDSDWPGISGAMHRWLYEDDSVPLRAHFS